MQADPRSLRYRALVVVVAAVVLPLLWVWVAGTLEPASVAGLRRELETAAREVGVAVRDHAPLQPIARRHQVRVRVVGPDGVIRADLDGAGPERLLEPVADPFYGPGGPPDPRAWDETLPPVQSRPESVGATAEPAATCERVDRGLLLLCRAAVRTEDGSLVHVQRGDRRFVRSLYEQRFQLTALTLVVLGIGALLALWVGARMVGPIESLRDQVVDRTRLGVSTRPVVLERRDELGELATAFNQLLRAIDERDRSNAVFAADLAHELKNPVAAVRAAAEALAADRPVEGERRSRLQRVLADSAARMEVVVHHFLELARAEAGLPDREREPVELLSACRHLVEGTARDERFAAVSFDCGGEEVTAHVVAERLETAIRNLLTNAAHYAGAGGRVTVTVRPDAGEATITVRDTGPGIPEGDLPKVFERYYTTREGGTGLGLALVKAITTAHGGTVEARSAPGSGATFVVRLPLGAPVRAS